MLQDVIIFETAEMRSPRIGVMLSVSNICMPGCAECRCLSKTTKTLQRLWCFSLISVHFQDACYNSSTHIRHTSGIVDNRSKWCIEVSNVGHTRKLKGIHTLGLIPKTRI